MLRKQVEKPVLTPFWELAAIIGGSILIATSIHLAAWKASKYEYANRQPEAVVPTLALVDPSYDEPEFIGYYSGYFGYRSPTEFRNLVIMNGSDYDTVRVHYHTDDIVTVHRP